MVRQGIKREDLLRNGVDRHSDVVVQKRLAVKGVNELIRHHAGLVPTDARGVEGEIRWRAKVRLITIAHRLRRDLVLDDSGAREAEAFVGAEEESFVLPIVQMWNHHRTARAAAEVIGNFRWFPGGCTEGNCIERGVLVIPERAAVEGVRAALGDRRDVARIAKLCGTSHALHLDFGERFRRRECVSERLVSRRIGSGDPVHRKLGLRLQSALNGKVAVIVRLHAGQDAEQVVGAVAVAGCPVVGGQVGDLERIIGGGDGLGFGSDDPNVRLHFHLLRDLAELQGEIDAKRLPRDELQVLHVLGLEAGVAGLDRVVVGLGVDGFVVAVRVGGKGSRRALVGVGDLDRAVGDHGAARVSYGAQDRSQSRLGKSARAHQRKQSQDTRNSSKHRHSPSAYSGLSDFFSRAIQVSPRNAGSD